MRLRSVTVDNSSAEYPTGAVEYGLFAATALKGANRAPISLAYAWRDSFKRARRAFFEQTV